jgi:hypothetical protein
MLTSTDSLTLDATKQQGKATKKEKQQAKQQTTSGKAGAKDTPPAASASSSNAAVTTRATALDQDGLKSRNHTLFLAPSCGATATAKSLPSWGNTRKDVSKSDSVTQRCVICGGSLVDDATYRLTLLGFLTGTTRLHAEILEYAQYTRHTVDDMAVHIEEMIANVRKCVQSLWPHSKVETFGSYSTGIWLPSSDVDLVILVRSRNSLNGRGATNDQCLILLFSVLLLALGRRGSERCTGDGDQPAATRKGAGSAGVGPLAGAARYRKDPRAEARERRHDARAH